MRKNDRKRKSAPYAVAPHRDGEKKIRVVRTLAEPANERSVCLDGEKGLIPRPFRLQTDRTERKIRLFKARKKSRRSGGGARRMDADSRRSGPFDARKAAGRRFGSAGNGPCSGGEDGAA